MPGLFNAISGFNVKEYTAEKETGKDIKLCKDVDFCLQFCSNPDYEKHRGKGFTA